MQTIYLQMSWSISRGAETYGYNIARLDDTDTGKRYRCLGGGYDMQGTVFGDWLQDRYQSRLRDIADSAHMHWHYDANGTYLHGRTAPNDTGLYGMRAHHYPDNELRRVRSDLVRVTVDGGCGLSSMERIAEAIGLTVHHTLNRRGNITGMIVTDTREDDAS